MVEYGEWGHPLWSVLGNRGEPYEPLPWQLEHIHRNNGVPRLIGCCGRRSGKTFAFRAEAVRETFIERGNNRPLIYIVAPNYELTMKLFEPLWRVFVNEDGPLNFLKHEHDKTRKIIDLRNGARIQAKSGDDAKALQGDAVTCALVDEAQDLAEEAWANLMPGLVDSKGVLRAIGIAKGKGRFRSYYNRGVQNEEDAVGRFYSFSVPSYANPLIDPAEIDAMRDEHTETEFRQQYLAEWVDVDGAVFRNVDAIFSGSEREPTGRATIMGLDIAKRGDYTWAMVGDVRTQEVIAGDRFTGLDYTVQVPRIANLYRKYKCQFIHMDTNGAGEAPADYLRQEGCSIVPFSWGNSLNNKAALIGTLAREIERGTFSVPRGWDNLRSELNLFEATALPGGQIRYNAPAGYHDDGVVALALLIAKMVKNKQMADSPARKPYVSFSTSGPRLRLPPLPRPKATV